MLCYILFIYITKLIFIDIIKFIFYKKYSTKKVRKCVKINKNQVTILTQKSECNTIKKIQKFIFRREIMMKSKKILALLLSGMMIVGFAGCSGGNSAKEDKVYKVGVIQLVQHDALDASYTGFKKALEEAGYKDGENIEIDYQNAAGDQSNCQTIADSFVNDKKDLIFAIATPAAQAVASKTTEIPILVTAVTDPKDAGIVESNEEPGTNVSGSSDLTPVAEQIDLLKQIVPKAKKVAVLYASNESNSLFQANLAKEAAKKNNLEVQEVTVSNSNEIEQVLKSVVDKVDAIYTPTDNTIAASMATVALIANEAKVPVICGEEGMVNKGGLITYGINYEKIGALAGKQAIKIFEGEDISKMPIEYLAKEELTIKINEDAAKEIGIKIPDDIKKQASSQE